MKKIKNKIIMSLLLAATINAHAIVADTFNCKLEVTENESGESTKQSFDLSLARLPAPLQVPPTSPPVLPDPNVSSTTASSFFKFKTENSKREINADVSLFYSHAVKLDSSGKVVDARQHTCFTLATGYCKKPTVPQEPVAPGEPVLIGSCMMNSVFCFSPDPFDPVHGWPITTHSDGIADFDANALNPIEQIITEHTNDNHQIARGAARVDCQYAGTYK